MTVSSRHLGASRRALFEELERSALKPLPAEPYVFAAWKECRVGLDYHVEIEKHYYSVPHQLLREKFGRASRRARSRSSTTASGSPRTCARPRTASIRRCASTCRRATGAMPTGRRSASGGRPARSAATPRRWSRSSCGSAHTPSKASAPASASCGSPRRYGRERLEAACSRALEIGARSYSSVNSILKNNLDRQRPATRRGRAGDSARQHPRPHLLPLRR